MGQQGKLSLALLDYFMTIANSIASQERIDITEIFPKVFSPYGKDFVSNMYSKYFNQIINASMTILMTTAPASLETRQTTPSVVKLIYVVALCVILLVCSSLHDTTLNWSTTVERELLLPEKSPTMLLLADDGDIVYWKESPLHDTTLNWSTTVEREWLLPEKPPAMLLLTNFGWNQPNVTAGLEVYRGLRTRKLVHGIINHPWFHPTAWEDINSGRLQVSPTTRYYIFLDRETCAEKNYPNYMGGLRNNRDAAGGRGECCGWREHFIHEVMNSTVMSSSRAKFVLFECGGNGPKPHFVQDRLLYNNSKLVFTSVSANVQYSNRQPQDLGLPPPVQHPYELSNEQRRDIESCAAEANRTKLLTYTGQLRTPVRQELAKLDNDKDIIVRHMWLTPNNTTMGTRLLHSLALESSFSAAPRGDNLFSYRFAEVMSCGSIPVVHADDWVFPFAPQLINWSFIVVILPESRANETADILRSISLEERCRMRRRVVEIYDRYLKTEEGTVNGIIESLERLPP